MLKTLQGVYRHGKIELVEHPGDIADETQVLVTILQSSAGNLAAYATVFPINTRRAVDRCRAAFFANRT